MSRRASDHIPVEILEAAKHAGQPAPLWYAGRTNGREHKYKGPSAHEIILEGRRNAGQGAPDLPPLGAPLPDPFEDR